MKYKFRFKALDSISAPSLLLSRRIESFIIERSKIQKLDVDIDNIEVMDEDRLEVYFDARALKQNFVYSLDTEKKLIYKGKAAYEDAEYDKAYFTTDELRFFDMLGYDTDKEHYQISTSTWWNLI